MTRLRYNGLKAALAAALDAAAASYSSTVLADSPVGYYRMGEASGTTMTDSSGNGHDGTYNGSPTLGATGLISADTNKAVAFTSSQWGQVNGSNAWFPSPSSFSIEAWIKPTGVSGTQTILASADSGSYPWLFQLQNNNLVLQRTSSGVAVASSGGIAAGGTYHVAATFDGTTAKVYINGALVASGAFSVATGGNGTNFYIGRDYVGSGFGAENGFAGVIDEVAIYSGVLTADKFASRYTNGTAAAPTVITFAAALTHSNGTAVPTLSGTDYVPLTLLDSLGNLSEIVWLTSYISGAATGIVTRAQEGTALASHASGDKLVQAPTAGDVASVAFALRSPGNITLNSTSYADVDTGADLTIPASVGDVLELSLGVVVGCSTSYPNNVNFTAFTRVGGADVNNVAGSGAGVPGWFSGDLTSSGTTQAGGPFFYTVVAGDISSGHVTLRLKYKSDVANNRTLFANATNPYQFGVKNLGKP